MRCLVVTRGNLLVVLMLSISCQSKNDFKNKAEPEATPKFEVEQIEEEPIYEQADEVIVADDIVNQYAELLEDDLLVQDKFLYFEYTNLLDSRLRTKAYYLIYHLGLDIECSDDVSYDMCANSIDNLIEATALENFPFNTNSRVPISNIKITNERVSEDAEPYYNYVLGVDNTIYMRTGANISKNNWMDIITEVFLSSDRQYAVQEEIDGLNDEALALEKYFGTRIIKHNMVGNDKFQVALKTLKEVLEEDKYQRNSVASYGDNFRKQQSFGVKAFQNIVVGNRNRDVYVANGMLAVEVDWEGSVDEVYSHLLKQANVTYNSFYTFTPFQSSYLDSVGEREDADENYKNLEDFSSQALATQNAVSWAYLDILNFLRIKSIRCDFKYFVFLTSCRKALASIIMQVDCSSTTVRSVGCRLNQAILSGEVDENTEVLIVGTADQSKIQGNKLLIPAVVSPPR